MRMSLENFGLDKFFAVHFFLTLKIRYTWSQVKGKLDNSFNCFENSYQIKICISCLLVLVYVSLIFSLFTKVI